MHAIRPQVYLFRNSQPYATTDAKKITVTTTDEGIVKATLNEMGSAKIKVTVTATSPYIEKSISTTKVITITFYD